MYYFETYKTFKIKEADKDNSGTIDFKDRFFISFLLSNPIIAISIHSNYFCSLHLDFLIA